MWRWLRGQLDGSVRLCVNHGYSFLPLTMVDTTIAEYIGVGLRMTKGVSPTMPPFAVRSDRRDVEVGLAMLFVRRRPVW